MQAEVEGPLTVGDLLRAAGADPWFEGAPVRIDGRLAHLDDRLDVAGLRPGSIVATSPDSPGDLPADRDPAEALHLAVTGGPSAGLLARLPPGPAVVGRAPECDVHLPDPTVSNRHFRIEMDPGGAVTVEDLGSRNGLLLDGRPVTGATPVRPGQVVVAGDSVMELRAGSPPDAVLHDMSLIYELRRPPRLRPAGTRAGIDWPEPPATRHGPVVPLASAVLPVVLGLVMLLVTRSLLMLLFLLMTPMLVVANFVTTRRSGRKEATQAGRDYAEAQARAEAALQAAQQAEATARREEHPDPATLLATVTGPRRRLWERRADDADFLDVRVGTATLDSRVRLISSDPYAHEQKKAPPVEGVPCVVSLRDAGVLGVSGPSSSSGPNAAWMVAQQVISTGPADLRLVVLSDTPATGPDRWAWARWLPHTASGGEPAGPADGGEGVEARAADLVDLVESRSRDLDQGRGYGGSQPDWAWVLVVLDRAHDVRRIPGMEVVLQRGPAVRVVALCVEEAESHLPPECRAVVTIDSTGTASLRQSDQPTVEGIAVDRVGSGWCQTVGRRLAPISDPEVRSLAGRIPAHARLVDLLAVAGTGPDALAARWQAQERSTAALVGAGTDGPFFLDLRTDGPHGLVAGTTGAGKSEFLQTLVASLAVANRPDAMNFLLVDYKGGSAFRDCARLPHTVGVVTDLDGHLVERALVSLTAELKRREELLARAAAKDIDDYVTLGQPLGPLPRLAIVIDEFAGLVTELPDFVTGLVGIAQRGRSLGIHLILATQRPSGVVSPEIRANTNLRVALRVVSPAESVDIIDAPDAARISPATPGRALAMTGHSTLVPFQAARVGGPAVAAGDGRAARVAVAPLSWATAGRRLEARPVAGGGPAAVTDPTDTDLARLATALIDAAAQAGIGQQRQPWLPALPEALALDQLSAAATPEPGAVRPVAVGLVDLPAAQRQEPWCYDPVTARHLLIAGSPGSGRTTALRTVAAALASGEHPDDVWIYVLDCGGGELRRLADLPHCGAVVTRSESDRADRLLGRLHREMTRRLDLLARHGHADLGEHRRAAADEDRIPYIVVLIDRWEGFLAAFDPIDTGRLTEMALDLAREGGSAGIRLVVTGDRQLLLGKLASTVEDRLCLNLAEPTDYSMAGLDPRRVPPTMGPGRALRTGDQAELQIALPGPGTSGVDQTNAVAQLASRWQARHDQASPRRPFRIDALPDTIDLAAAGRLPTNRAAGAHWALVGVGGDELTATGLDLLAPGGFVVAGPRRSGRSTALVVMARSLLSSGSSVLAMCPRPSPLRRLAGSPGVIGVLNGDSPPVGETLELINSLDGPLTVLVDDAYLLHNSDLAELLEAIARDGPEQGHVMVVAGTGEDLARPMRGFITETRQSRTGLLLCPESHLHGEVVGVRLPRSAVFSRPPGRGVLAATDRLLTVQVPWPG